MGRDELDRYYTPDALAEACLELMLVGLADAPFRFAEPCCGGGAFGRAALRLVPSMRVKGCDIDPEASPGFAFDVCSLDDWHPGDLDLIATNPPYKSVYEAVAKMRALQLDRRAGRLGLLLRATTIEQIMCSDDPPDEVFVTKQRARWGGAGGALHKSGDSCGSAFMVWHSGPPNIEKDTTIKGMADWRPRGRA
jgi:hypothetical protein